MNYLGDFVEDDIIYIYFTTTDSDGGLVAPSSAFEAADVKIFKDGSDTEKTSTDGLTMTSPFNGVTGLHALAIDTNNNTNDSGWWVTGVDYSVILDPSDETVDSQTVAAVLATWSCENRFMRGTDGANTTTPPTASAIADEVASRQDVI